MKANGKKLRNADFGFRIDVLAKSQSETRNLKSQIQHLLFARKLMKIATSGRSSGSLRYFLRLPDLFSISDFLQKTFLKSKAVVERTEKSAIRNRQFEIKKKLTATGIASVLHRIPF